MKKIVLILFTAGILLSQVSCSKRSYSKEDAHQVANSVSDFMLMYPWAALQDVYKVFFQDRYGPGHMISNREDARIALENELKSTTEFVGNYVEPCGWEHNYYRVNLSVISDGIISFDDYFNAFYESVNAVKPPSFNEWKHEWAFVMGVIDQLPFEFEEKESQEKLINEMLDKKEYVVHHSYRFERRYRPHYRIMSRKIIEERFPKLLELPVEDNSNPYR